MASKRSTQHGASANGRQTSSRGRFAGGSAARTRKTPAHARKTPSRTRTASPARRGRTAARSQPRPRWVAPLLVVAATGVAVWFLYTPLKIHYAESREQHRLESELVELRERNAELREQVERLKTPEGIEEVARSSLGFVKEGENLYVVVEPEEATATALHAGDSSVDEPPDESLWVRVLDVVFGVR